MIKAKRNVQTINWTDFVEEFNWKFYNSTAMSAQQIEFLTLQQEEMTVAEVVRKFEWLAKLCPYLVPTKEQRAKQI